MAEDRTGGCPVCGKQIGGDHGTPAMAHDCEHPGCAFGPLHTVGYHLVNGQRVPAAEDRTGVVARLDALEAAHKAGTADGPWRSIDRGRADPECRYEILDDEGSVAVCSDDNDATASTGADRVALIVAAVNDLPDLLAAVRGVLVEHQPIDDGGINSGHCAVDGFPWPCLTYRTVAAALGEA